jgi:hypothetical protein
VKPDQDYEETEFSVRRSGLEQASDLNSGKQLSVKLTSEIYDALS